MPSEQFTTRLLNCIASFPSVEFTGSIYTSMQTVPREKMCWTS